MKPPPLLLGAALLFWGWQSDLLLVGALLAVVLESARLTKARWEFSDEDFSRIWTFCCVVFLGAAVYAFTSNEGPATFGSLFQNPNFYTQRNAGASTAKTAASLFRWLPMIFFPFLAMQMFSTREMIPLATISLILRRRWKKAKKAGKPTPASRDVNIAYPYFGGTLLAASVHPAEGATYFWGLCALLAWALWAQRSRRFAVVVWVIALAVAVTLGFFGQRSIGQFQRYLENFNAQWVSRFMRRGFGFDPTQSRTALGNIGEIKTSGRIGIWLETKNGSPPPTYLRAASYRGYKSPIWFAGSSKDDFTSVQEDVLNSGEWTLLRSKSNNASVNITCYLAGRKDNYPADLLPLPTGSARLENFFAYLLQKNSAGAVLAEGPRLVMFDALYGPGATIDSFADTNEDLKIPDREKPALDSVIEDLQLRGQSAEQAQRTLAAFFADKFTYSKWQGLPRFKKNDDTPLSRFLLQTRSGHCEYFATATVLLLRRAAIPARYAVGWSVHEGSGGKYVVRARDAHAWCLVWDKEQEKWLDFDTTPASWVSAEGKNKSAFQWLSDFWTRIGLEISKIRYGQSKLRQYLLWIIVPVLALLLYRIIFRRGRRRQRGAKPGSAEVLDWPGLDSEFYQLENKLAERGVPRGASEPLNEWLHRMAETPDLSGLRAPLEELLRLHYRYRFDPLGLSEADRELLKREARKCLEKLSRAEKAVVAGK
ncbi:MAG: transglutaminase domain-containing protein [Verrucomicrobia bacterium]|nr:transglutaminase domain-containing protein [Verrucomicrobiota bacterium]